MRRFFRAAVVASLAALLPGGGEAVEYAGSAGVGYTRSETWTPEQHGLVPRLTLTGNLGVNGNVGGPDMLRWGGDVNYESVRETYGETDGSSDGLTYALRLGAFERRNSAFRASGSVSRTETDFATEAPDGSASTGLTRIDAYDVGFSTGGGARRPSLSVRGLHREASNSGFGRETVEEASDQLVVGFAHGPGPYSVAGTYTGTWNEGTLFLSDYTLHTFGLNAASHFGAGSTAALTATHQQRIPGSDDPLNPTTESNSVQSSVDWLRGDTRGRVAYSYVHNLATAPAIDARELFSHGVGTGLDHRFSDTWSGAVSLGAQLSRARLGEDEQSSAGQSLSLLGRWHRSPPRGGLEATIEAGPRVGLLEPAEGDVQTGYGGSARVRLNLRRDVTSYGLDYLTEYESNLGARKGWVMRQQLHADAESTVGRDLRLRASVIAMGVRQEFSPFGANASRTASIRGTAAIPNYSLTLELGIAEGLQAGLAESVQGDGLFFPESYDTRQIHASVIGTARVARRLGLTTILRYATQSGADLPAQQQASAAGILSYSLGRFRLSLEDRYVAGGASDFEVRSNMFFVRLTRAFGGRL